MPFGVEKYFTVCILCVHIKIYYNKFKLPDPNLENCYTTDRLLLLWCFRTKTEKEKQLSEVNDEEEHTVHSSELNLYIFSVSYMNFYLSCNCTFINGLHHCGLKEITLQQLLHATELWGLSITSTRCLCWTGHIETLYKFEHWEDKGLRIIFMISKEELSTDLLNAML